MDGFWKSLLCSAPFPTTRRLLQTVDQRNKIVYKKKRGFLKRKEKRANEAVNPSTLEQSQLSPTHRRALSHSRTHTDTRTRTLALSLTTTINLTFHLLHRFIYRVASTFTAFVHVKYPSLSLAPATASFVEGNGILYKTDAKTFCQCDPAPLRSSVGTG
jgi:hypothetical protein